MKWENVTEYRHYKPKAGESSHEVTIGPGINLCLHRYTGDRDGWYVTCLAIAMSRVRLGDEMTLRDAQEAAFTAAKATARAIYLAFEDAAK